MAAGRQTPEELGRRIRAARAYRAIDQIPLAKKLGCAPSTLGSYEEGAIPKSKVAGLIEESSAVLKLPEAFFVIDFKELTQMNDAWEAAKKLRRPLPDLERLVEEELDGGSPT